MNSLQLQLNDRSVMSRIATDYFYDRSDKQAAYYIPLSLLQGFIDLTKQSTEFYSVDTRTRCCKKDPYETVHLVQVVVEHMRVYKDSVAKGFSSKFAMFVSKLTAYVRTVYIKIGMKHTRYIFENMKSIEQMLGLASGEIGIHYIQGNSSRHVLMVRKMYGTIVDSYKLVKSVLQLIPSLYAMKRNRLEDVMNTATTDFSMPTTSTTGTTTSKSLFQNKECDICCNTFPLEFILQNMMCLHDSRKYVCIDCYGKQVLAKLNDSVIITSSTLKLSSIIMCDLCTVANDVQASANKNSKTNPIPASNKKKKAARKTKSKRPALETAAKQKPKINEVDCNAIESFLTSRELNMMHLSTKIEIIEQAFHILKSTDKYVHCHSSFCFNLIEKPQNINKGKTATARSTICSTCGNKVCIGCGRVYDLGLYAGYILHNELTCEQVDHLEQEIATNKNDDALASLYFQPCPRCERRCNRDGGCNALTCKCGHKFKWVDRVIVPVAVEMIPE